jgi:hypothetical protein
MPALSRTFAAVIDHSVLADNVATTDQGQAVLGRLGNLLIGR